MPVELLIGLCIFGGFMVWALYFGLKDMFKEIKE